MGKKATVAILVDTDASSESVPKKNPSDVAYKPRDRVIPINMKNLSASSDQPVEK